MLANISGSVFDGLQKLKPIHFFLAYIFIRGYFFRRRNGAPIAARRVLLPIAIYIGVLLRYVFGVPIGLAVIPFAGALIYSLKGIGDIRKGRVAPDNRNINYSTFLSESFIVFVISFAVIKLLGIDYFLKGF